MPSGSFICRSSSKSSSNSLICMKKRRRVYATVRFDDRYQNCPVQITLIGLRFEIPRTQKERACDQRNDIVDHFCKAFMSINRKVCVV